MAALNKGDISLGVFVDLTKAFDYVDHKILLDKLERNGVWDNQLLFVTSYLSYHNQRVYLSIRPSLSVRFLGVQLDILTKWNKHSEELERSWAWTYIHSMFWEIRLVREYSKWFITLSFNLYWLTALFSGEVPPLHLYLTEEVNEDNVWTTLIM